MTLYSHALSDVTLDAALKNYADLDIASGAVALLYGPRKCRFALWDAAAKKLKDEHDGEVNLAHYFEARVFNQTAELRWLSNAQGRGRAALLAESSYDNFAAPKEISLYNGKTLEQTYLLWGQGFVSPTAADGKPAAAVWGCLSEARIGQLYVPHPCQDKQRLRLKAREYLGYVEQEDDEGKLIPDPNGNVVVVEERLLGLEAA